MYISNHYSYCYIFVYYLNNMLRIHSRVHYFYKA